MMSDEDRNSIAKIFVALFCLCAGLILVLAIAIAALTFPAKARDNGQYAQSHLKGWFDSLKSGKGPCCSDADGTAISDVDWEAKDGHYRVRIEGQWVNVPDEAVIKVPNLIGRTMVWPIYYRSTLDPVRIEIRCFMPGSMT